MISRGIQSPRAITLDPHEGILFWTDWDENTPRIESADLSGNDRKVIFKVSGKIDWWNEYI